MKTRLANVQAIAAIIATTALLCFIFPKGQAKQSFQCSQLKTDIDVCPKRLAVRRQ